MYREKEILKAVKAEHDIDYTTIAEAVEEYGMVGVFDCWLKNEGLVGYTSEILEVLAECGFDVSIDDWKERFEW